MRAGCMEQGRMDAGQRAALIKQVGDNVTIDAHIVKGVVGYDDQLLKQGLEPIVQPLNNGLAVDLNQALGPAVESAGQAAGQDGGAAWQGGCIDLMFHHGRILGQHGW